MNLIIHNIYFTYLLFHILYSLKCYLYNAYHIEEKMYFVFRKMKYEIVLYFFVCYFAFVYTYFFVIIYRLLYVVAYIINNIYMIEDLFYIF